MSKFNSIVSQFSIDYEEVMQSIKSKSIRWKSWQGTNIEHLEIFTDQDGSIVAKSDVTGEKNKATYELQYRVVCNKIRVVREVQATVTGGACIHLFSDGQGNWNDTDGTEIAELKGCIDVDIEATPFTNTLPIRRLELATNESEVVKVAYFSLPTLKVTPADQRYTCLKYRSRYRYEGLSTQYVVELETDEDGIVLDYPDTFRRI